MRLSFLKINGRPLSPCSVKIQCRFPLDRGVRTNSQVQAVLRPGSPAGPLPAGRCPNTWVCVRPCRQRCGGVFSSTRQSISSDMLLRSQVCGVLSDSDDAAQKLQVGFFGSSGGWPVSQSSARKGSHPRAGAGAGLSPLRPEPHLTVGPESRGFTSMHGAVQWRPVGQRETSVAVPGTF